MRGKSRHGQTPSPSSPLTPHPSRCAPRTWLFDLDNTLHDANPHIFPHINRAMREYIERLLGVDAATATTIRQGYWDRYGATLHGLVRHHNVNPHHFLAETHRFPDLRSMLVFDPTVRAALDRLPGRKIIYSNAPRPYTEAVLELTRLGGHFDAIYTVESLGFRPKPSLAGFRALLHAERLQPANCIMIEDSLINLVSAKKLGLKTVWVSAGSRGSPYVDVKLRSLRDLPRRLGWL